MNTETLKTCSCCGETKPLSGFWKNADGLYGRRSVCITCIKTKRKTSEFITKNKEWAEDYYNRPGTRTQYREYEKRYENKAQSKEIRRKYHYERYQTDLQYRITCVLRSRLWDAVKNKRRGGSAVRDLGCSLDEFINHISQQLQPDWSWDNYGKIWEIDHILPLKGFNLEKEDEIKKACHYTNLRPLSLQENRGRN